MPSWPASTRALSTEPEPHPGQAALRSLFFFDGLTEHPMSTLHPITPAGFFRLKHELDDLLYRERPAVTQAVSEAAAMGDRSENAEYQYGKKRLREIDRRIRFLSKRLPELRMVDRLPDQPDRVFFGARVQLEDAEGVSLTVRIVGVDEFDPAQHWISLASPMARALLGKRLEEECQVRLPSGQLQQYWVVAIDYQQTLAELQANQI